MRHFGRLTLLLAVTIGLLAVPAVAHGAKTLGLSSGAFEFTVDPGTTGEGQVVVSNDGDEPLKALVYVADVSVNEDGEETFEVPQREGTTLLSTPATWFQVFMPADSKAIGNTPYVELDAGEQLPIKFQFSPPRGAAPGDHNIIIFFEMFEFSDAEGSTAQVSGRLGARVALRVTGQSVEELTVRPFVVPVFRLSGDIPYRFAVNNEGNLNERVQIRCSLLDRSETEVSSSILATDVALFAGSGKEYRGALGASGSNFGPHTLEVRVSYVPVGATLPVDVVSQRSIWLVPLWFVVLLGFIIVYSAAYLVRRATLKRSAARAGTPRSRRRTPHRVRDAEAEERRLRREQRAANGVTEPEALSGGEPPLVD